MALARYFLMRVGGRWCVTLDGRVMSTYPTQQAAVSAAVIMADLMGAMHHDADVMVEPSPGQPLELVWSYGRDEVPVRRPFSASHSPGAAELNGPDARQARHGEAA